MKRSRYQISPLQQQLKPSWIIGSHALDAPRAFTPTKDVILKLNFSQSNQTAPIRQYMDNHCPPTVQSSNWEDKPYTTEHIG